jgi:glucan 1,3-beta-glucosidase
MPINRRELVRGAPVIGMAELWRHRAKTSEPAQKKLVKKWRGVNLGGWLVLEKWITPQVFAGTQAEDEFMLSLSLGRKKATALLQQHRESWIGMDDFKWIAQHGLNAVRLPVGYWVIEDSPPFISGAATLDFAFRAAKAQGLGILLDLHGVPGSQNGWDHSGRLGTAGWHTDQQNISRTLEIVEHLAAHCRTFDNLIGFELLNEPHPDVPLDILKGYYQDAYRRVRKHIGNERAMVVIHDGFHPYDWANFMAEAEFSNVALDTHLYQGFTEEDKKRDIYAHVEIAAERKAQIARMQQQLPCIVGEWSCALDPSSLQDLEGYALDTAMRAFGAAQLLSYETARGWFFWTYKTGTEAHDGWNFRDCVDRGWLPDKYRG